jgi:hypothetical protein
MNKEDDEHILLVGKQEGKRPLRRPRCRWVDNIKIDLGKIRWGGMDWIGLIHDRDKWISGGQAVCSTECWEVLEKLHNWWPLE